MKKSVIAAALALGFGAASAAPLVFDPTGTDGGGAFTVDQLDWSPAGVLAIDGNQAIANFLNGSGSTEFTVLSHASLAGGLLGGSGVFSTTGQPYEITAVLGFREKVINATTGNDSTTGGTADFQFVAGAPNFVRIYYGTAGASSEIGAGFTKDANMLEGTGFNNGHTIFESTLTTIGGQFAVEFGPVVGALDQSGNGNQWNSQQTVSGYGVNAKLTLNTSPPAFVDTDFFKNTPLLQFLIENVSLNVPFTTTDPSYAFTLTPASGPVSPAPPLPVLYHVTTNLGTTSTLGPINGGLSGCVPGPGGIGFTGCTPSGPDFIFSTDTNSSVQGTIPEPGSLALAGLALAAIGGLARRRGKFF